VSMAAAASSEDRDRRDGAIVALTALAARFAVVAWAARRFPAAADGTYYERLAERLAQGSGYTWLWPDGAVTYAAHYPVGYPAALAAVYSIAGTHAAAAMVLNAVVGALGALAVHSLAARAAPRRYALLAGLLVALHPALVMYTPAVMTEGVTAALVACAAALVGIARATSSGRRFAMALGGAGVVLGMATLVRPQSLILAPIFGALAMLGRAEDRRAPGPETKTPTGAARRRSAARALGAAIVTTLLALTVCAPWTLRNCSRMGRCALVSVNGGWNLLIGADAASTGAWSPIQVPEACREVWDEAAKDECFGRAARTFIAEHPLTWAELAPRKLAATFDYCGAAGWYLHESNPIAFGERAKIALGALESAITRCVLLAALFAVSLRAPREAGGPWLRRWRFALAAAGAISLFTLHGWIAYLALVVMALSSPRSLIRGPLLVSTAIAAIAVTMATHAVFFGSGRYSLVVLPLLCGLSALVGGKVSADSPSRPAEVPGDPAHKGTSDRAGL
jgi:hypothetical protein